MVRGVSGGQKKRVTTGEMIVGPCKTLMMDEISTGLDSSTTFQITKILANFAHMRKATLLVALLQPAPEVYDQFDDILLLSEGTVVFHGPREEVRILATAAYAPCYVARGIPVVLRLPTAIEALSCWSRYSLCLCLKLLAIVLLGFCNCWASVTRQQLTAKLIARLSRPVLFVSLVDVGS